MRKKSEQTQNLNSVKIKTFTELKTNLSKKIFGGIRKDSLENYLKNNEHLVFEYKEGNIYVIQGAKYDKREFHIAEKLVRAGYHVLFPNEGDLGKGRKNDVYLYDTQTYMQMAAELKSLFGDTAESVKSNLISGSGQASIIVYDIQSNIKKQWLIKGLRNGWSDGTKKVMLNWKGRWCEIDKRHVFERKWLENNLN
jgi:hypothetical protein